MRSKSNLSQGIEPMNTKQFLDYCESFYLHGVGIYPIATHEQILRAVYIMVKHPQYCGDSVDRERVRALIEAHQLIEECIQNA
jgi:hypothetical protein